jgi:hypothetical protein
VRNHHLIETDSEARKWLTELCVLAGVGYSIPATPTPHIIVKSRLGHQAVSYHLNENYIFSNDWMICVSNGQGLRQTFADALSGKYPENESFLQQLLTGMGCRSFVCYGHNYRPEPHAVVVMADGQLFRASISGECLEVGPFSLLLADPNLQENFSDLLHRKITTKEFAEARERTLYRKNPKLAAMVQKYKAKPRVSA